tara:strand:+ start:1463 stop:2044 length:582 start_codon:yes stop_codon:yes gene_type:complete
MGRIKDKMIKDGDDDDDDGYDHYEIEQAELEYFRQKVIEDIGNLHEELFQEQFKTTTVDRNKFEGAVMHDLNFHAAIWKASTETLPNLEVQVVIDNNNNCFVSTGSPGYVDFFQPPVGMTLPIRCWIHTHPFGAAYFSGTDIRTVSIWEPNMECAYVLGDNQYGFWENQFNPKQLEIFLDNEVQKTQTWGEEE